MKLFSFFALFCTMLCAQTVTLPRHVSPRVLRSLDQGPVAANFELDSMAVLLQPSAQQQAELATLLAEQQRSGSPLYHQWLTAAEYADRFGVSAQEFQKVRTWLESEGFRVQQTAAARNWIFFTGTHAQVTHAFHTSIHRMQYAGRMHYANVNDPEVPAEFAHTIAAIHGLTDFHLRSQSRRLRPRYTDANGFELLAPADLAAAYDLQPLYAAGFNGKGVSIAIIGQTDFYAADINGFRSRFNLPANSPKVVRAGTDPGIVSGDVDEAELDLEWSGAVAPGATVKFVTSGDVMVSLLYAIDNSVGNIISLSYGECESDSTIQPKLWRGYIQQANAMGMTVVVASGDSGAATCDYDSFLAAHGLTVSFPASIPEVTAVGGTTISAALGPQSGVQSNFRTLVQESAWNDAGLAASTGGGASKLYPKPSWQTGPGVPQDTARDLPDVALAASAVHFPYAVCLENSCGYGLFGIGGTSAGAPSFAGMLAVLAQYEAAMGNKAGLGNVNSRLYQLAQSSPASFHPILSGSNIVDCQIGTTDCTTGTMGFTAGPGYNQATGLGSIDANVLVATWDLTATRAASTISVSPSSIGCALGSSTEWGLTASVVPAVAGTAPTGTVAFYLASGGYLGSAPLSNTNGVFSASLGLDSASVLNSLAPLQSNSVLAIYSGDSNFLGATSVEQPVYAGSGDGPLTVSASPSRTTLGQAISFKALEPSSCGSAGQVTFSYPYAGGTRVFYQTNLAVGQALNFQTNSLPSGSYPVTVSYGASRATIAVTVVDPSQDYTLSAFAGSAQLSGTSGDGGPATQAGFGNILQMAVDSSSATYIADAGCNCVRKIDATGTITTVVGGSSGVPVRSLGAIAATSTLFVADNLDGTVSKLVNGALVRVAGTPGACKTYSGDGGPALSATLCPTAIAVDQGGNLYIVTSDFWLLEVSTDGNIYTIAGTGSPQSGFVADGAKALATGVSISALTAGAAQDIFLVLSAGNNLSAVYELTAAGVFRAVAGTGYAGASNTSATADGPALFASFYTNSIATDGNGTVYILDSLGQRVLKVASGIATTVLGPGYVSSLTNPANPLTATSLPAALAFDPAGRVLVAENGTGGEIVALNAPAGPGVNSLALQALRFVPVAPCRVVDTRIASSLFGGFLQWGETRDIAIPYSECGIPYAAKAYSLNLTVVPFFQLGYVSIWPSGQPQPYVSTLNSPDGRVKANAVMVGAGNDGGISIFSTDLTDVVLDINGYYLPANDPRGLAFYPLTPCRVTDTRNAGGTLGGTQSRTIGLLQSGCGVPQEAQAYSLNFTAVPKGALQFLTVWPTGQPQPNVSTLNAPTGATTANAAIVPAGMGGAIDVYASDATDVIVDINGYYAPPAAGGLSFYEMPPCRVWDTRLSTTQIPLNGTGILNLSQAGAACPTTNLSAARAAVVNATVLPTSPLGFLALWPDGEARPVVSTLNAWDKNIVSNMAIVPLNNSGLDVFTSSPSHVILDVSGYFAP